MLRTAVDMGDSELEKMRAQECPNITGCANMPVVQTLNEECALFQVLVSVFLIGVISAFGLVGNVLSILTFQREKLHSVTSFLLSALCISDIGVIFPACIVILLPSYCEYFKKTCHKSATVLDALPYIEQFGWAVISFAHTCTVYMTVLVALHRYFFVCRPHDCHRLSGLRRARIQAIAIPLVSLIFNLPRLFEYKVREKRVKDLNSTELFLEYQKQLTSYGENPWFQKFYKNFLYYTLMFIVPLGMLIVLSVLLLKSLRQRRRARSNGGSRESDRQRKKRDDNVTLVLVIIIGVFVVCQAPLLVQRLMLSIYAEDFPFSHDCYHPYFFVEQASNFFLVLNSCINFAIYLFFARRFRTVLLVDVLKCSQNRTEATTEEMQNLKPENRELIQGAQDDEVETRQQLVDVSTQAVDTGQLTQSPQLRNKALSIESTET
jgi:hypothetical protein